MKAQSDDIIPITKIVASLVDSPPIENYSNCEQVSDSYRIEVLVQTGHLSCDFLTDHRELLVHNSTVDNASQIVVRATKLKPVLHLAHYLPIVEYLVKAYCRTRIDAIVSAT